jgi:hypothetical protein
VSHKDHIDPSGKIEGPVGLAQLILNEKGKRRNCNEMIHQRDEEWKK